MNLVSPKHKPQQGFTLVEAMVVVAVSVILIIALLNLYDGYNRVYNSQQNLIRVAGSAGAIINDLQIYVSQADQVLGSHTFSGTNYSSGTNTLVLEIPTVDSGGNILTGKFDYAAYYASGTKVYRLLQTDASSSRASILKQLSDSASSLSFAYDNGDFTQVQQVNVNVQTQIQVKQQAIVSHLTQSLYLRNHK